MKTAQIEQFLPETSGFEALLAAGQTIHLTLKGRAVALVTPFIPERPAKRMAWPDFAARQRSVFGEATLPAGTIQTLIDEDRG